MAFSVVVVSVMFFCYERSSRLMRLKTEDKAKAAKIKNL
jgi:hypothetical protein